MFGDYIAPVFYIWKEQMNFARHITILQYYNKNYR